MDSSPKNGSKEGTSASLCAVYKFIYLLVYLLIGHFSFFIRLLADPLAARRGLPVVRGPQIENPCLIAT